MKKQWLKLCMTACVVGGIAVGAALGQGAVSGVMGTTGSVAFAASGPNYRDATVLGNGPLPGMFSGNYAAIGVQAIGFRVQAPAIAPSACRVYLYAANGDNWHLTLGTVSNGASVWTTFVVPLNYSAGWQLGDVGATAAQFNADLQNVGSIQVKFIPQGEAAQTYTVSNLALLGGKSIAAAADLYNWMVLKGVSDINADPNHDGYSNWAAYVAGTTVGDANDELTLTVVRDAVNGDNVQWSSVAGKQYQVLRATSLTGGFAPYGAQVAGNGSQAQVPVDSTPCFYRLQVVQ